MGEPRVDVEQIRALVDSVRDYAIFMLDREGRVRTWNEGARAIKGYEASEIIGESFTRFYPPADIAAGKPQKLLAAAVRDGRVEDEGWRVRKDGRRFWSDVVITALRNPAGELIGFTKVTRDLTERRATEEALRMSEERLRQMIASVRDYAIFMLDVDGNVTTWNPGAEAIKGYPPEEIIGQNFSRFYTPEDIVDDKPAKELAIAAAEGRYEEQGWRVRKDGTRFWANAVISAVHNSEGRLVGFAKVTRDMTEERRLALALEARARQQATIAALGVYALQTGELGALTERATRVIVDTLGAPGARVVEQRERPHAEPDLIVAVPGGEGETTSAWLVVEANPDLPYDTNEIDFVRAIGNVIATARRRREAEDRLRAAERLADEERVRALRARDAVRERDEFIAIAAHELRTPLTALQLKLQSLQALASRGDLEATRVLDRIAGAVRQSNRMTGLVERLLDVSRIVGGRLLLQLGSCDLAAVIREVCDELSAQADLAGAPLQVRTPPTVVGTWDSARLQQAASNLISNAIKYGGSHPVEVEVEDDGTEVRLIVRDHGIGIAAEDVERIFRRFERAVPVSQYGGLGLGLYVTRHIVEAHGGSIDVTSQPSEGSRFVVHLPRRNA